MDIAQKKKNRYEFLNKLYDVTDGDSSLIVDMWELGKEINIERRDISNIVDYLKGEYLIEPMTLGGGISITHEGILEIEELKPIITQDAFEHSYAYQASARNILKRLK